MLSGIFCASLWPILCSVSRPWAALNCFSPRLWLRTSVRSAIHPPHPWFASHAFVDVVHSHLKGYADRLVVLDGDAEVLPGINVMLLGGHTMGSQAVMVQTDAGPPGYATCRPVSRDWNASAD